MNPHRHRPALEEEAQAVTATTDYAKPLSSCPVCDGYSSVEYAEPGPHRHGFLWLDKCGVAGMHVHQRCGVISHGCGHRWTSGPVGAKK